MTTNHSLSVGFFNDFNRYTSKHTALKILGFLYRVVPVQFRPGAPLLEITREFVIQPTRPWSSEKSQKESRNVMGDGTMTPPRRSLFSSFFITTNQSSLTASEGVFVGRINFEDSVYKHPSFPNLLLKVGDVYRTKGMLLTAWELAQLYWLEYRAVPRDKWPAEMDVLIEATFARVEKRIDGDFVYVSGSKEACAFLEAKSRGGKKGGKSKNPAKLANLKQNKKTPKQRRNRTETEPNLTESSSSVSISYSSSISDSSSGSNSRAVDKKSTPEVQPVVKFYCDLWKTRYKSDRSPDIRGKDVGLIKSLVNDLGRERVEVLVHSYLSMPDSWFVTKRHDIPTLVANLNAVSLFADSGRIFSKSEIKQLDQTVALQNTLESIRTEGI